VADNMVFGYKVKYEGAVGTAIAKVFDQTVASTGLPILQQRLTMSQHVPQWKESPNPSLS